MYVATPILRTLGLVKRYGRVTAVDRLDLTVRAGQIYGFLGRNGAGKTTAIRMMMGIIEPDRGKLEYFGETVRHPSVEHRRRIGYVSQEQHFYRWMTPEDLGRFVRGFYPAWDPEEYRRLLHLLSVPPDRKVVALSGGMRTKLALALALAHRPDLLMLDEPTAGLDPAARREFLEIVDSEVRGSGRGTFFSSHLVDEVERVADRVGIIDHGALRYEGDLATLRATVRRIEIQGSIEGHPEFPPGFQLLSERRKDGVVSLVARAPVEAWITTGWVGTTITKLSLEDIFLALTVGRG